MTHDHSWINDVVDAGEMTEAEASVAPGAHAITRCLGAIETDAEEGAATRPSLLRFPLPGPGRLLLCTDGLWNYAPHAHDIIALLQQAPMEADATTLARILVAFANAQGRPGQHHRRNCSFLAFWVRYKLITIVVRSYPL